LSGARDPGRIDGTVVVLAKSPRPGRVKTRLCPPCDPDQAARLAEAALDDTLRCVRALPIARRVLALDGLVGEWLPDGFRVVAQRGGDLGARLARSLDGVTGPTLVIGMDTPQLRPADLRAAFRILSGREVDAVLGHAVDGGWWSLGLKHADGRVFAGVETSTPHTGRDQLARLRAMGLSTRMLPRMRDVDTMADAHVVARLAPRSRFAIELHALSPAPAVAM
jgi:rSAM/selenodomain-associated transferase 1